MVATDMDTDTAGVAGDGQAMDMVVDKAKAGAGAVGDGQAMDTAADTAKDGDGPAGDGQAMDTVPVSPSVIHISLLELQS